MKLAFCPFIDLLSTDIPVIVDCRIVGLNQNPKLRIDNVLDSTGKVSLLHNHDSLFRDIGYRLADLAEYDEELLERAKEQHEFEREAA